MNSLQNQIDRIEKRRSFDSLDQGEINDLVKLIAYISETSFRRGFQHGCDFEKRGQRHVNAYDFRYKRKISLAPYTLLDCKGREDRRKDMTALWRLDVEYGRILDVIGLSHNDDKNKSCKSKLQVQLKNNEDLRVKLMLKNEEYKNKIKEYESMTGVKL